MEEELDELLLEQLDGYFDYLIWEYQSERIAYIYDGLDRTRLIDTLSIPKEDERIPIPRREGANHYSADFEHHIGLNPPTITTDRDKLFACYSLVQQMIDEHKKIGNA